MSEIETVYKEAKKLSITLQSQMEMLDKVFNTMQVNIINH
jgi:hypothetical protein